MVIIDRFEGEIAVVEYEEKYYDIPPGPGYRLELKRGWLW